MVTKDQILEVNGEPCSGEDISSKLEDRDVKDIPKLHQRIQCQATACCE